MKTPFVVAGMALLMAAGTAAGQTGGAELGVDASLRMFTSPGQPSRREFALPARAIRVSIPLSDHFSLESTAGWEHFGAAGYSADFVTFHGGGVWTWRESDDLVRPYVRASGGLSQQGSSSDSHTQWNLGTAAGVRIRVGPRLWVRAEGGYQRWFGSDELEAMNVVHLTAGFSVAVH